MNSGRNCSIFPILEMVVTLCNVRYNHSLGTSSDRLLYTSSQLLSLDEFCFIDDKFRAESSYQCPQKKNKEAKLYAIYNKMKYLALSNIC